MLPIAISTRLILLAMLIAGTACLNVDVLAETTTPQVKVSIETLDKYVGTYQLSINTFVRVTRKNASLFIARAGSPASELVPQNDSTFAYKDQPMTITFADPGKTQSGSLTLRKNVEEQQLATRVDDVLAQTQEKAAQERIKQQKPMAGGEAALRQQILTAQAGRPAYEAMTANLEARMKQMPAAAIQQAFAPLGELKSLKFVRVNNLGADIYYGAFANGAAVWEFAMAGNGKVEHMEFLTMVVEAASDAETLYSKTMSSCARCSD
ncbi:MAG: hypothetical protein QM808_11605 [Steroidobacteraceae bacterium]